MAAGTPPLSYTCELCGADGMSEADMRTHTVTRHVSGRPACPFCELAGVSAADLLLHVNQAHLDYLTPEAELMAFIDDQSPGYDEDSKATTDSCSYNTPTSLHNGWHSPESAAAAPAHSTVCNGAISKNSFQGHQQNGKRPSEAARKLDSVNSNGVLPKTKKKAKSRENSSEEMNDRHSNCTHHENDTTSKKIMASAGQGSPLRTQLALKLKSNTPKKYVPSPSPTVQCLMCEFTSASPQKLEEHMNRAHFDLTSPSFTTTAGNTDAANPTIALTESEWNGAHSSKFTCPICDNDFPNGSEVELHVNVEHRDILSPQKAETLDNARGGVSAATVSTSPCNTCPVCSQPLPAHASQQEVMAHIEEHFERGEAGAGASPAEREARRRREQQEFEQLRAQYGMEEEAEGGGYSGQAASSLRRAVYSGELSVSGYYERSMGLRRAGSDGVEDGGSCTQGILERIVALEGQHASVVRTYLCSAVDHYASTYGDRGWGCGYRNMQMVISCLLQHPRYSELVWRGAWDRDSTRARAAVPSILRLQHMVERAWQMGFDLQGSEQLGSKLVNTRKWIGACEVVTVLSSLRIQCQLIDFHKPTGADGGHPALFDWVLRYFQDDSEEFKPPLYLQHQGHSRTIIGYERHRDGKGTLLILDPSHAPAQVRQVLAGGAGAAALRLLRRGSAALRARQYQLVAITGLFSSDREYEASKVLQSVRIPQDR